MNISKTFANRLSHTITDCGRVMTGASMVLGDTFRQQFGGSWSNRSGPSSTTANTSSAHPSNLLSSLESLGGVFMPTVSNLMPEWMCNLTKSAANSAMDSARWVGSAASSVLGTAAAGAGAGAGASGNHATSTDASSGNGNMRVVVVPPSPPAAPPPVVAQSHDVVPTS